MFFLGICVLIKLNDLKSIIIGEYYRIYFFVLLCSLLTDVTGGVVHVRLCERCGGGGINNSSQKILWLFISMSGNL